MQFDPVNLYKHPPGEDVALFNLDLDVPSYTGLIIGKDGKVSPLNSTAVIEKSLPLSHIGFPPSLSTPQSA